MREVSTGLPALLASQVLPDRMVSPVLKEKEAPLVRKVKEALLELQGPLEVQGLQVLLVPKV